MIVRLSQVVSIILFLFLQANAQVNSDKIVITRGPYLQVVNTHGITIRWRTNVKVAGMIRCGVEKNKLDKVSGDTALTMEHIIQIKELTPHTRYFYAVGSPGSPLTGNADNYFYTLPETFKKSFYRIGVFGDCGNNSVNQLNVKDQFLKYLGNKYMDAWILLGDNAYSSGRDAEFQQKFFNIYKDDLLKKYPLFPSPGNHDYTDGSFQGSDSISQVDHKMAYYQNFSMPSEGESGGVASHTQAFYSFDIGNIHFLSLDSYGNEDRVYRLYDTLGPQVQWIKKDLEQNKNKGWVIAYWHHPPYTMGSHNSDEETDLVKIRENFIPILERYGVDLILCGHSHVYERSRLMSGNYGMETSFNAAKHNLSSSSARYDNSPNSCPYIKDSANRGTVYVVSGSAGQLGGKEKSFPHDAMYYSNAENGGADMLEVQGNRLDLKWICADGVIRDHFTMMKQVNRKTTWKFKKGSPLTLTASFVCDSYSWDRSNEKNKSVTVLVAKGINIYTVTDAHHCMKDVFTVIGE